MSLDTAQPPLRDYGLIGNSRTAALVSNRGSIDWCCFPYFDSDSCFAAILDRSAGGCFSISPSVPYSSLQSYLPDTNVLQTHFKTSGGKARLTDCFSVTTQERRKSMFFPANEILRKLEVIEGEVPFVARYAPKPHYNRHPHTPSDQRRLGIDWNCGDEALRFVCELEPAEFRWRQGRGGPEAFASFVLRRGQALFFSVSFHRDAPAIVPALGDEAQARLELTIDFWKRWIRQCRYVGRHREAVKRSALALKLMTFAPSGAIVAAPTTSLPEKLGGTRNWDYRYAWTRDAAFAVRALLSLGYYEEASAYLNWMIDTGSGALGRYQVMYGLFGARTPPERILEGFSGYRDSLPVRVGNAARDQFQLDIFGEVLDAVVSFSRVGTVFDGETRRFLIGMGRTVCENWHKPDSGIWEPRAELRHYTHSKVMAWLALDRLISFGKEQGDRKMPIDEFCAVRGRIREAVETRGYDPGLGSYVGAFDSDYVDAALLTLPLLDYCDARTPRMRGTIDRVRQKLSRNELVYRYLDVDDGLPGQEGCFGVCSFWLIEALAKSGRRAEALRIFERFLSRANSVGLWPEEIDPDGGDFLGNYPQAFTHIGVINSALTLEETAA